MAEREQLAVSYAAFILSAQGAAITKDSINAVLAAASQKASQTLVNAVVKALNGRPITDFFGSVSGGSAPAPVAEKPAKETAKPAEKPVEKAKPKQEPKPVEEQEMDMGGLFD